MNFKTVLVPGKYVIGEVCYAVDESKWSDRVVVAISQFDNMVAAFETGPASYETAVDQFGFEYAIESSTLVAIHSSLVDCFDELASENSRIVQFDQPAACYVDDAGMLVIGEYEINWVK